MSDQHPGIDPTAPPSGPGCQDCLAGDGPGWWFHLRRCAHCGHIGCCDASPSRHARGHAAVAGHPVARSFEPGESWFWDYEREEPVSGPPLAPPEHRPPDQPAPGPEGKVPPDWRDQLHR
jgi:hypothetical protein